MIARLLLVCCVLVGLGPAVAALGAAEAPSAREVLRDERPNWYDADADDWRRVPVQYEEEHHDTGSRMSVDPAPLAILPTILYALIVAGLIALVVWFVRSAGAMPEVDLRTGGGPRMITADLADLPFTVEDTGDPEGALATALEAGDHRAALIWIYACMLLRLDAHGHLRLHRSKTNRCYLGELADSPFRPPLKQVVEAFERMYFGGFPPAAEEVAGLHATYRAMRRELEGAG